MFENQMNPELDKQKLIDYWITSSDEDIDTMITLFENKKYSWSLFLGHLAIEKLMKALFVHVNNEHPPYIHNLIRLAEKCKLNLDADLSLFFATITAFNINSRYDDYKQSFKKKYTPEYTLFWI